jgi:hypothetical protein
MYSYSKYFEGDLKLIEAGNFSLPCRVQNVSDAHPAFYPMGFRGFFLWDKTAGA